jgi:hypothetical protein
VLCCTSCALCTALAACVVTSVVSFYCDYVIVICLGGPVVSVLATGPKVAGSIPAEVDGFLSLIKIRSTTSFVSQI